jgi:hypothetical protein
MADREQPYDPYIPAGGAQHGGQPGAHRTEAIQEVGLLVARSDAPLQHKAQCYNAAQSHVLTRT